jgi:ribonuclease H / adenosylcobalamin/alpha-ribazole phosphatase
MTRVIVEADGGSRGNPGPAGYGAVVRDADTGEVLREVAAGIGVASNNVAEYRGLIAGLEAALDLGAEQVEVRMDSLLVVNQMSQVWKVKHEAMRPLASEAAGLVRQFTAVKFRHVRRELNKHADRLANEAMDDAAKGVAWQQRAEVTEPQPRSRRQPTTTTGWSAPSGPATRLLLLRHGETALSAERRFSGRGDPELNERGQAQARAAAVRLSAYDVSAVVSSPLRRAMATATAVADALGVDVNVDDGFIETDFGRWEGLTFPEIRDGWRAELAAWLADPDVAPPDGESFTATFARVQQAREKLLAAHAGGTVVVVSHVTPIKTLLRQALDAPPQALYRLYLDTASLSTTDWWADGQAVVRLFNDTSHLSADLMTPSK